MEYLSETFSQISLEEKRQLTSQYTLFTIGANELVKKLDNRFTVLLNKLRIQKVTKSDQEICETFLNALCRDDWNSNRKILMDRLNPHPSTKYLVILNLSLLPSRWKRLIKLIANSVSQALRQTTRKLPINIKVGSETVIVGEVETKLKAIPAVMLTIAPNNDPTSQQLSARAYLRQDVTIVAS